MEHAGEDGYLTGIFSAWHLVWERDWWFRALVCDPVYPVEGLTINGRLAPSGKIAPISATVCEDS